MKKVPLRKDLASGEMFPKNELLRLVIDKEGNLSIDPTGKKNGRGAYIKNDLDALKVIVKKKSLEKAFKTQIPSSFYEEIKNYIKGGEENGKR